MNRFKYIAALLIIPAVLFGCDSSSKPDYLSTIPNINTFEYHPVSNEAQELTSTQLTPHTWLSDSLLDEYSIGTPFWVEKIGPEIWMADPRLGLIRSFNEDGSFSRTIGRKGSGPNEFEAPAVIHVSTTTNNPSEHIRILDSGSKSILEYSYSGLEANRISSKHILSEYFGNRMITLPNGNDLIPIGSHDTHVIGSIDKSGNLVETYINRIIPPGYQPITHNRVFFDYEPESQLLFYAYHGLPLLFIEGLNQNYKRVYDFKPETELEEYNTGLDLKPLNEVTSVKSVIRDLFIKDNYVYFRLHNDLIQFNYDTGEIHQKISFAAPDGRQLLYQQIILSADTLFLINRLDSRIDFFPLSEL